jgi:hypothetical protein
VRWTVDEALSARPQYRETSTVWVKVVESCRDQKGRYPAASDRGSSTHEMQDDDHHRDDDEDVDEGAADVHDQETEKP